MIKSLEIDNSHIFTIYFSNIETIHEETIEVFTRSRESTLSSWVDGILDVSFLFQSWVLQSVEKIERLNLFISSQPCFGLIKRSSASYMAESTIEKPKVNPVMSIPNNLNRSNVPKMKMKYMRQINIMVI